MAFRGSYNWHGLSAVTGSTQSISNAISVAEGYGVPGAIPTVRNNPGDLTDASGNIITYATPQQGWDALNAQVNAMMSGSSSHYNPSMTWNQIGQIYAADNTGTWANNVASQLGVSPNSTLASFTGSGSPLFNPLDVSTNPLDVSSTGDQSVTASSLSDWGVWVGLAAAGFALVYVLSR